MSEKSDGVRKVSRVMNWQAEITAIAGPMSPSDTRESWLARAARKAGISYRQCKAMFYGETTDPKWTIALEVARAAAQARKEAQELAAKFESIAGSLNAKDQDFHCDDVLALIDAARALRGLGRTGDHGGVVGPSVGKDP